METHFGQQRGASKVMWMNEIEAVNFEFFGKDYPIKDIKDIDEYANYTTMNISIESVTKLISKKLRRLLLFIMVGYHAIWRN